jgi:pimeloyl-ACP methyl ester carboxylesterase
VSARNRLGGIAGLPTLLLWGGSDKMIPSSHVEAAREELPASRVEIFDRAGHFPHLDEPDRFAQVLEEFMLSGAQQAPADTDAPVEERSASAS